MGPGVAVVPGMQAPRYSAVTSWRPVNTLITPCRSVSASGALVTSVITTWQNWFTSTSIGGIVVGRSNWSDALRETADRRSEPTSWIVDEGSTGSTR